MRAFIILNLFLCSALAYGVSIKPLVEVSSSYDNAGNQYVSFKGKNYFIGEHEWENWYNAWNKCAAKGMRLLSIESSEESEFLRNFLAANKILNEHRYWTSGNDLGRAGTYTWFGTGKVFSYTNWKDGEPSGGDEHCIYTDVEHFKWNDFPCHMAARFICEELI